MRKLIICILCIIGIYACNKDFDEINTNPNAPGQVQPELLLRQIIYSFGEEMSYEGFVAGNLLGQYFTQIDFNLFDRHSLTEPQFGGNPWPILYKNLRDNEILLRQSRESPVIQVYEGPALILKAYLTAVLTDLYGDVPYSEALRGSEGNVSPKYDTQEMIYLGPDGILANIDQAIEKIMNYQGVQQLEGDILFEGNLDNWIRFANSLKIKYLMRISGRINVEQALQTVFNDGRYMVENEQNAIFNFTDGQPNSFRMAILREGDFNLFVLSETMEEILKDLNDPRLSIYFRPISNNLSEPTYKGLLNGPDASQTSISVSDYSLSGTIFREHTGDLDANFMTAWETQFFLAEAAERGLIMADAKLLYDQAIHLAFEYWNTSMPPSYLSEKALYGKDGKDKLGQIITQKWIANIINGYEGWIDYRRTGYPVLKPISASLNNDLIPVRLPYPTDEQALNATNFNAATAENNNSVNSPVWWDK